MKLSIESEADLYDRALRNAERLEADLYIPETMYERMKTDGWPGDTEGVAQSARTLRRKENNFWYQARGPGFPSS